VDVELAPRWPTRGRADERRHGFLERSLFNRILYAGWQKDYMDAPARTRENFAQVVVKNQHNGRVIRVPYGAS